MALRRKPKRSDRSKIDATPPWETRKVAEIAETFGPYDVAHAPDDDLERIDFGALRIPPGELELRVEVDPNRTVVSVLLADEGGSMQLGVFAAPRTAGIWDEVRAELRESITEQGGSVTEQEDEEFGPELTGKITAPTGFAPVRILGIDGPKWFLRAMLVGAPAQDADKAEPFLTALRNTVVVRGVDPAPVRETVPLTLPAALADQLPT